MRQVLHDDFASDLAIISMMVFFSVIALGLSIAGVYSVIAYTVSRRLPEIGIRLAMGAERRDVGRMVVLQGLRPVVAGMAIGGLAGLVLARMIANILYGVHPADPATFLGVPALILVAATAASLVPATRAARVDPVESLRAD